MVIKVYHIKAMKTIVLLAVILVIELFINGAPANSGEWLHGVAVGVVSTCLFIRIAWRCYNGRD